MMDDINNIRFSYARGMGKRWSLSPNTEQNNVQLCIGGAAALDGAYALRHALVEPRSDDRARHAGAQRAPHADAPGRPRLAGCWLRQRPRLWRGQPHLLGRAGRPAAGLTPSPTNTDS